VAVLAILQERPQLFIRRNTFSFKYSIITNMKKVLVSYTTFENPDTDKHLKDIQDFNITEFAVFLSAIKYEDRQKLFGKLDRMADIHIPCCHARSDILPQELAYMVEHYGTTMFNIHRTKEKPLKYDLSEFKDKIYIENPGEWIDEDDLKGFAGICLDLTHLKHSELADKKTYNKTVELLAKYKIGFNHISALGPARLVDGEARYDYHYLTDMSQLDYLREFPKEYFADYIAIELGNDIATQLEVKAYVDNLI